MAPRKRSTKTRATRVPSSTHSPSRRAEKLEQRARARPGVHNSATALNLIEWPLDAPGQGEAKLRRLEKYMEACNLREQATKSQSSGVKSSRSPKDLRLPVDIIEMIANYATDQAYEEYYDGFPFFIASTVLSLACTSRRLYECAEEWLWKVEESNKIIVEEKHEALQEHLRYKGWCDNNCLTTGGYTCNTCCYREAYLDASNMRLLIDSMQNAMAAGWKFGFKGHTTFTKTGTVLCGDWKFDAGKAEFIPRTRSRKVRRWRYESYTHKGAKGREWKLCQPSALPRLSELEEDKTTAEDPDYQPPERRRKAPSATPKSKIL